MNRQSKPISPQRRILTIIFISLYPICAQCGFYPHTGGSVGYVASLEQLLATVSIEANLKELCARIVLDLDNCSNQEKKDAYTYLGLRVKATPEGADIKGLLDPNALTTGQTWA